MPENGKLTQTLIYTLTVTVALYCSAGVSYPVCLSVFDPDKDSAGAFGKLTPQKVEGTHGTSMCARVCVYVSRENGRGLLIGIAIKKVATRDLKTKCNLRVEPCDTFARALVRCPWRT